MKYEPNNILCCLMSEVRHLFGVLRQNEMGVGGSVGCEAITLAFPCVPHP